MAFTTQDLYATIGGGLLGVASLWLMMGIFLRAVQDLPLGPFHLNSPRDKWKEEEKRGIQAQHRLVRWWFHRLWPLPAACLIAGIVLLANA